MLSQGRGFVPVKSAISEYKIFFNNDNKQKIQSDKDIHTIVEITGLSKPKRISISDYTMKCFAGNIAKTLKQEDNINQIAKGNIIDINV